jgi:hypothetical protein
MQAPRYVRLLADAKAPGRTGSFNPSALGEAMILIRLVICVVLFCLPFLGLIMLDGSPDAMIYLLFPIFGAIPGLLAALLVFVPIERLLERRGEEHLKNFAVPAAGALLIFAIALVVLSFSGDLSVKIARIMGGGLYNLWPFLIWSLLGAVWGGLWRLSDRIGTALLRPLRRRTV